MTENYRIPSLANKASKRQETSTSDRSLLPANSAANEFAASKADDPYEIEEAYTKVRGWFSKLEATEETTFEQVDEHLCKCEADADSQCLANLLVENEGGDEVPLSFLHYLLRSPQFFDPRLPLLKWTMRKFPHLYTIGAERGKSILHVLASKSTNPNTPSPLSKFVKLYPQEVTEILTKAGEDKAQQAELLSKIIPAIKLLDVPDFLNFFGECQGQQRSIECASDDQSTKVAQEGEEVDVSPEGGHLPSPEYKILSEEIGDVIILRWPEDLPEEVSIPPKKSATKDNVKSGVFQDNKKQTLLHLAASYCDVSKKELDSQFRLVERVFHWCPEALETTDSLGRSPYLHRIAGYPPGSNTESSEENKDEISLFLKNKIMHLPDRDTVLELLYGQPKGPRSTSMPGSRGPEREIYLDLRELQNSGSSSAGKDELIVFMRSLKLENILQYVQVPQFPVRRPTDGIEAKLGQNGIGRRDFKEIFDVLAKKGIRNIHKLVVDDDEARPHQDEIIETLNRFEIEEFQWRKIDISSEVLWNSVRDVRTLRLFSSGNQSVLRDWSSPDGLKRLPQLSALYLKIYWKVESRARIETYAKDFITRMITNNRRIKTLEVRLEPFTAKTHDEWPNRRLLVATNKWLQTMQKFANFVCNYRSPEESRELRVAVVDDGIDWSFAKHLGLDRCHGKSFYPDVDGHKVWYSSSTDHGTLMTALIDKICPFVKFYVVRLDQTKSDQGEFQPTPDSAAKASRFPFASPCHLAIDWARQMDVHIISMSWTIPGEHQCLNTAVSEAKEHGILMFGSASDQGAKNGALPYMAKCAGDSGPVICIGGAFDIGFADERASIEGEFFFPGQINGMPPPLPPLKSNYEGRTGSSVATAVAVGFTALIMLLVDMSPKFRGNEGKVSGSGPNYRKQLQDPQNIRRIFKNLLPTETTKRGAQRDDTTIPVEQYFKPQRLSNRLSKTLVSERKAKAAELLDGVLERILRVLIDTYKDKKATDESDDGTDDSGDED